MHAVRVYKLKPMHAPRTRLASSSRKLRARLTQLALGLLLLLGLAGCGAAQPKVTADVAALEPERSQLAPHQNTPGLFLYEVESRQHRKAHLLGTMHVGFGFDEVLTEDARKRFVAATRVILEADVTSADPNQMRERALLPQGESLRSLLGEPGWHALVERLGAQIPEPFMERMKPWLPTVTLGLLDLDVALREIKPQGRTRMMDVEVMTQAKAEQKPLIFLETVDEQLAMFDLVPLEEQVRELRRTLLEGTSQQGKIMLRAFADGDEEALTTSLFDPEQMADAPGFFDIVLHQRNDRWLPVLERELETGGSFIAVGAAHLLGDRGLLAELKRRGYSVQRVGHAAGTPKIGLDSAQNSQTALAK